MEDFAFKAVWLAVWLVLMATLIVAVGMLVAVGFEIIKTVF